MTRYETLAFEYETAFSRNLGWVTAAEQEILRHKRVAIAGMGGAGGIHLLTLARLGIGAFHIADFDTFGMENFNRQAGAFMSTIGRSKTAVMAAMARDINPEMAIEVFPAVTAVNVNAFLTGVDLYVDALDTFAFDARQTVYGAAYERNIPASGAAPIGMGAALVNIMPGQMSFEDYFCWGDLPDEEKGLRLLAGLAPRALHSEALVDPTYTDFTNQRVPSTPMGVQLCAGVVAAEALKILLRRGKVIAAPRAVHFDAYSNKMVVTWRPGGNRNPLQKLLLAVARRKFTRR